MNRNKLGGMYVWRAWDLCSPDRRGHHGPVDTGRKIGGWIRRKGGAISGWRGGGDQRCTVLSSLVRILDLLPRAIER